ncbi:MAG: Cupin region [Betaproteobacteria bacterium]|nr:Cupin region [Betaproteobacteria bacterium]
MTSRPRLTLPALDPQFVAAASTSNYPAQFKPSVAGRAKKKLGDALGLKNFGVNLTTIEAGGASALRHWHLKQDEFVYVISGELVLVSEAGEQLLTPGMCAGFSAGVADGHHLVNRSDRAAMYLEVGDRTPGDGANYPDDDLIARAVAGGWQFTTKNGEPY